MAAGTRIVALLSIGILTFCLSGAALALEWGAKEIETEKLAIQFANQVKKGGYGIVATEELKAWVDKKEPMLIVDTMPLADSYKKNHIPSAVQMEFPLEELTQLDDNKRAAFEKLLGPDKARKIVIYCGFTKCGRSHNGALWAVKLGYTNVWRHPGGIKAWMESGYSIEKGQ